MVRSSSRGRKRGGLHSCQTQSRHSGKQQEQFCLQAPASTHCCAPTTQRTFDATAGTPHGPLGSGAGTGSPTSTCAQYAAGTPHCPVGRGSKDRIAYKRLRPHAVAQPRTPENLPRTCRVSISTSTTVTQDLATTSTPIRSCSPPHTQRQQVPL